MVALQMLTGYDSEDFSAVHRQVNVLKLPFVNSVRDLLGKNTLFKLSECCLDFLQGVLTFNPAQRPTIALVLRHPWLTGDETGDGVEDEEEKKNEM